MSECTNHDVQDLLPEFVAGVLPASERAEVEGHLAVCVPCRDDLAVLEAVRGARPVAPALNLASIVAALPAPPTVRESAPMLRVITSPAAPPSMARATRPRRVARTWWSGPGLRAAAALTLVALGGLSVAIARRGTLAITDGDAQGNIVLTDAPLVVADLPVREAPRPYSEDVVPIVPVVAVAPAVLPVQELSDYTEAELAHLLDQLERWDGAPSVDITDPTLPPPGDSTGEEIR